MGDSFEVCSASGHRLFEDISQPTTYANEVNAVGFAIINEIKLKIKTVTADNQDGTYLNILNELTIRRKLYKVKLMTHKIEIFSNTTNKMVPLSFSYSKFTWIIYQDSYQTKIHNLKLF